MSSRRALAIASARGLARRRSWRGSLVSCEGKGSSHLLTADAVHSPLLSQHMCSLCPACLAGSYRMILQEARSGLSCITGIPRRSADQETETDAIPSHSGQQHPSGAASTSRLIQYNRQPGIIRARAIIPQSSADSRPATCAAPTRGSLQHGALGWLRSVCLPNGMPKSRVTMSSDKTARIWS